jgi:hypothetical protein
MQQGLLAAGPRQKGLRRGFQNAWARAGFGFYGGYMPAKTQTQGYATGQSHSLGIYVLKLNIQPSLWKELGERLYLIAAPNWLYEVDSTPLDFDDFKLESEPSTELAQRAGSSLWSSPIRLELKFITAPDGSGMLATCVSFFLSEEPKRGLKFGLAHDCGPNTRGFVLYQGLDSETLWKQPQGHAGQRIFWPSVWQPDVPWKNGPTLWRLPKVLPYFDSHLHIQSNHVAPLPIVWDKFPASKLVKMLQPGYEGTDLNLATGTAGIAALGAGIVYGILRKDMSLAFDIGGYLIHFFRSGRANEGLDDLSKVLFGESGKIGVLTTYQVSDKLGSELRGVSHWGLPFYPRPADAKRPDTVWALSTPLPMDMHYGHFNGYFAEPIYHEESNGDFSFNVDPFTGKRGRISAKEAEVYEEWEEQLNFTKAAAKKDANQWRILPHFHFDPRRYRDDDRTKENWEKPFPFINSAAGKSEKDEPFIGVKTYTSLGYMPLDPLLPWQKKIYERCEKLGIPWMNHCTVEGAYTHEKPFFYDLWKRNPETAQVFRDWEALKNPEDKQTSKTIEGLEADLASLVKSMSLGGNIGSIQKKEAALWREKCRWFDEHYIYPKAWEQVATDYPKLKLCLAHFCGYDFWGDKGFESEGAKNLKTGMVYGFPKTDSGSLPDKTKTNPLIHQLVSLIREDNQVHADISFFFFTEYNRDSLRRFFSWARTYKKGLLLDRILWGSDWPLLIMDKSLKRKIEMRSEMMRKYAAFNFKELCAIDPELWIRFTTINPARFYGIRELVPHLGKVLKTPVPEPLKTAPYSLEELYALPGKAK